MSETIMKISFEKKNQNQNPETKQKVPDNGWERQLWEYHSKKKKSWNKANSTR